MNVCRERDTNTIIRELPSTFSDVHIHTSGSRVTRLSLSHWRSLGIIDRTFCFRATQLRKLHRFHTIMKQVVFLRHGESLGQIANKKVMSRRDPSLTDCFLSPKGIQQAKGLKDHPILNSYQFDLICTSPLTRAFATCCLAFGHLAEEQEQSQDDDDDRTAITTTFVVNADIREIGSRIPENRGRPVNKVLRDIRKKLGWISQHRLDRFDFTMLPHSWPEVPHADHDQPKRRDAKDCFIEWLRSREETTIAVICHYNTIRWFLENRIQSVPNCQPIECIFTDGGKLMLKDELK